MANSATIQTARLNDKQVIELLDKFRKKIPITDGYVNLGGEVRVDHNEPDGWKKLKGTHHAIQSAVLTSTEHRVALEYHRGIAPNPDERHIRATSSYFDEVSLVPFRSNQPGGVPIAEEFQTAIAFVEGLLPVSYAPGAAEGERAHDVIDVLRTELSAQAEQHREMMRELNDQHVKMQKAFEKERQGIAEEHTESRRLAMEESEQLRAINEADKRKTQEQLAMETSELEERLAEVDDREHMHARRKLRADISQDVKNHLGKKLVSSSASRIRQLVTLAALLAAIGLTLIAVTSFFALESLTSTLLQNNEVAQSQGFPGVPLFLNPLLWGLFLRSILASIGAFFFLLFAINWLRKVYDDDVATTDRLRQHGLDIDRASWAIETIIEVGGKEGTPTPETWIKGACRNLFMDSSGKTGKREKSTDALAALFNSAKSVKVGTDGAEVEMGSRGSSKFAKGELGQD